MIVTVIDVITRFSPYPMRTQLTGKRSLSVILHYLMALASICLFIDLIDMCYDLCIYDLQSLSFNLGFDVALMKNRLSTLLRLNLNAKNFLFDFELKGKERTMVKCSIKREQSATKSLGF